MGLGNNWCYMSDHNNTSCTLIYQNYPQMKKIFQFQKKTVKRDLLTVKKAYVAVFVRLNDNVQYHGGINVWYSALTEAEAGGLLLLVEKSSLSLLLLMYVEWLFQCCFFLANYEVVYPRSCEPPANGPAPYATASTLTTLLLDVGRSRTGAGRAVGWRVGG